MNALVKPLATALAAWLIAVAAPVPAAEAAAAAVATGATTTYTSVVAHRSTRAHVHYKTKSGKWRVRWGAARRTKTRAWRAASHRGQVVASARYWRGHWVYDYHPTGRRDQYGANYALRPTYARRATGVAWTREKPGTTVAARPNGPYYPTTYIYQKTNGEFRIPTPPPKPTAAPTTKGAPVAIPAGGATPAPPRPPAPPTPPSSAP